MEREGDGAWAIVGATIVVVIVLAVTVQATVGWSDVGAAWIQAVGSVLALFVTGGMVVWGATQQRKEARRVTAERLLAKSAILLFAANELQEFIEAQERWDGVGKFPQPGHLRTTLHAFDEVRTVSLNDMPNETCVEAMARARTASGMLKDDLERVGLKKMDVDQIESMKLGLNVLRGNLELIQAEAAELHV